MMAKDKVSNEDFERYLQEAKSWETNKVREADQSKRTAWIIAGVASCMAISSVLAIAILMPLKRVDPFVIRVDNSTGIVDVVNALEDGATTYDEAINKYFVQWYVRYREGYSKDLAEEYYYNVGIMSAGQEQQRFYDYFTPKNPLSPLNVYGHYAAVKIKIKSTSFVTPSVALVRYTKEVERGRDKPDITHWAATITFKYSKAPMSEKDRAINPLGFLVYEYRNDPEAPNLEPKAPNRPTQSFSTSPGGISMFPASKREFLLPTDGP